MTPEELNRIELGRLTEKQQAAVERVIERARQQSGRQTEALSDREEAYAYQGARGSIHWGVNGGAAGWCVARGKVS